MRRSSKHIHKNASCVDSRYCLVNILILSLQMKNKKKLTSTERIEDEFEVRSCYEPLQSTKIEDGLEQTKVVVHTINDLHLKSLKRVLS